MNTQDIVDKVVLDGDPISFDEALALCKTVKPYSRESYYLQWGAHQLLHEASGGYGLIYSQIGLDANPCPGNCWYCSFGVDNNNWDDKAEVPLDVVLEYCRIFNENGVHLISLMTTANYSFDQYIEVLRAVRQVISPNVAIMINIGDFGLDEAQRLKEVGGDVVYHAVRVGEGDITSLDPQRRWGTIHAALDVGLHISSGAEPLYHGVDLNAVVQRMFDVAQLDDLICSGVGVLVCVEGTKMENYEKITKEERRIFASIWQLVAGKGKAPFGGENLRWIDAGANPRGTQMLVGEERIKRDIELARKDLVDNEWVVPDQSVPLWDLY